MPPRRKRARRRVASRLLDRQTAHPEYEKTEPPSGGLRGIIARSVSVEAEVEAWLQGEGGREARNAYDALKRREAALEREWARYADGVLALSVLVEVPPMGPEDDGLRRVHENPECWQARLEGFLLGVQLATRRLQGGEA